MHKATAVITANRVSGTNGTGWAEVAPPAPRSVVGYLHLTVQLISGDRQVFVQTDPNTAQHVLNQIRPERLFAQRHFIIAGAGAATIIPTESVERVEVRTDPLPDWPYFPPDVAGIEEITEEAFRRVQRRGQPPPVRVLGRLLPAPRPEMAILVRVRSGAATYLRVRLRRPFAGDGAGRSVPDVISEAVAEVVAEAVAWEVVPAHPQVTAEDAHRFLSHLFARPVLFGRTEDGDGLFLLNPANAVSFTLAPPPPGSVAGAWPMGSTTA
jgi:hypothetical protein